jgi:imidazolonepropionase-like amidohydrolase
MAPAVKDKAIRVGNDMAGNFAKAHKAGVNVAYGTDSGISPHGTNAQEAVLMTEAGMSEMDVIVAATLLARSRTASLPISLPLTTHPSRTSSSSSMSNSS